MKRLFVLFLLVTVFTGCFFFTGNTAEALFSDVDFEVRDKVSRRPSHFLLEITSMPYGDEEEFEMMGKRVEIKDGDIWQISSEDEWIVVRDSEWFDVTVTHNHQLNFALEYNARAFEFRGYGDYKGTEIEESIQERDCNWW